MVKAMLPITMLELGAVWLEHNENWMKVTVSAEILGVVVFFQMDNMVPQDPE
jgi:hypothetical protein